MMRPWRAFIMPRSTALDVRNTEAQVGVEDGLPVLVLHAHQQVVAGDAGIVDQDARWRRTRFATASTSASMPRGVGDVEHAPVPPLRGQALADRRGAGFAGGGADDASRRSAASSSAIAAPMPRLAPVTSAIFSLSMASLVSHAGLLISVPFLECGLELGRRAERARLERFVDALGQAASAPCPDRTRRCAVAPRATSACTHSVQRTGRYSWRTSAARIASALGVTRRVDVLHHRDARHLPAHAGHDLGQTVGGVAHQRRVRGHADRAASPSCARRARPDRPARDPPQRRAPPITIWPGELKLAGTTDVVAGDRRADFASTSASSAPSTAAIAPMPAGTASCIRRPRSRTRRAPSRQRQRAGGDQRGVLAQAMAGQRRRCGTAAAQPGAPHGDASGQQRRLGVFGAG